MRFPRLAPRIPPCAGVKESEISFFPDWEELAWTRWRAADLEIQRDWLAEQTKRLALIANEIDAGLREAALIDEQEKQDAWWLETAAREAEQNKILMEGYQKALDAPRQKVELARLERVGLEIRRDSAHFERQALKRRGVLRGTR